MTKTVTYNVWITESAFINPKGETVWIEDGMFPDEESAQKYVDKNNSFSKEICSRIRGMETLIKKIPVREPKSWYEEEWQWGARAFN